MQFTQLPCAIRVLIRSYITLNEDDERHYDTGYVYTKCDYECYNSTPLCTDACKDHYVLIKQQTDQILQEEQEQWSDNEFVDESP